MMPLLEPPPGSQEGTASLMLTPDTIIHSSGVSADGKIILYNDHGITETLVPILGHLDCVGSGERKAARQQGRGETESHQASSEPCLQH